MYNSNPSVSPKNNLSARNGANGKNGINKNNDNCCYLGDDKKAMIMPTIMILNIFLVIAAVSMFVGIFNKLKDGKAFAGRPEGVDRVISASGTGEVYSKPDLAIINISVVTEKVAVSEALKENTDKVNSVINYIKSEGIEDKDIKTAYFDIYPQYEYPSDGKRTFSGYTVSQELSVNIRNMDKIGAIIQGSTEVGANEVRNLQFIIDNKEDLVKEARGKAIDKAKQKAQELASQLGVRLVKITSFSESDGGGVYPVPLYSSKSAEAYGMGGGAAPDIQTGENKITVSATVSYEIE